MPALRHPLAAYAGIGLVAGVFSALFGVGGGLIVVPLLIVLFAFPPKLATGTSLLAIGVTAAFGVVAYGILGRLHWQEAVLVGLPAVIGVVAGTWLQQRLSSRTLTYVFAVFLVAIAVRLLVT